MYLLAGAIATLVFLFVPGMRIGGLLNLIALSSPIAILIALRMNHVEYKLPWLLIALGQLFFVTGDVITYNYERFFGTELPYPVDRRRLLPVGLPVSVPGHPAVDPSSQPRT